MGGSFYLIPSSVHEFILIKDDGTPKAKDLNKMIKNVNETVLEPRDYLSDQCYHYDAKEKRQQTLLSHQLCIMNQELRIISLSRSNKLDKKLFFSQKES